jgi:7-carboxy-7-deazaguanine synthase (Cx14CxxC type)
VTYAVKEIFYTLQGEGINAGRPAVFCRFAGCNLWSGRELDRPVAACSFCDTEFVGTDGSGGGKFERAADLAKAIAGLWPGSTAVEPFVVCTGGEPLLQLNAALVDALADRGFVIAIETNGTCLPPDGIDWICVSPKAGAPLRLTWGDELKLVYPQPDIDPRAFESYAFDHFLLQPMDGSERERNTALAIDYCLAHPRWRLSLQTHKFTGIR